MPAAPRPAARAAGSDESVPLITRAGVPTAGENVPTSTREPRLFLGLRLYQWGLLAAGVALLYLLYLAGAGWAWMHEGRKYHILAITLAVVSGVRGPVMQRAPTPCGCVWRALSATPARAATPAAARRDPGPAARPDPPRAPVPRGAPWEGSVRVAQPSPPSAVLPSAALAPLRG